MHAIDRKIATYEYRKTGSVEYGTVIVVGGNYNGVPNRDVIKKIEQEAINRWQADWNSSQKGRTTYAFIEDVRGRIQSYWLRPNHYTSQILTGHGDFKSKLEQFRLIRDASCYCQHPTDDVEHHLMGCPLWTEERQKLFQICQITVEEWPEAASKFVANKEAFKALVEFSEKTLEEKKKLREREEEAVGNLD